MWQRFTERARRAVFFAQEEAKSRGMTKVSTGHLLLGLLREKDCVAVVILDRMGVSPESVRSKIESKIEPLLTQTPEPARRNRKDMQLAPDGKHVIDLAYDEARLIHNNYIGTEHLLLGILRAGNRTVNGGSIGMALQELGANLDETRRQVCLLQNNDSGVVSVDSDAEPGLAFAQRYAALSVEHRAALEGDGASLSLLPEAMQQIIKSLFEQSGAAGHVIVDPNATIRVYIQRIATDARENAACRYIVTAQATFVTNFLLRDT